MVLNHLSNSPKPDILMVLKYKIHIIIVKLRKAGRELTMQDIPGEWFVKLSQVWYSHGIKI